MKPGQHKPYHPKLSAAALSGTVPPAPVQVLPRIAGARWMASGPGFEPRMQHWVPPSPELWTAQGSTYPDGWYSRDRIGCMEASAAYLRQLPVCRDCAEAMGVRR